MRAEQSQSPEARPPLSRVSVSQASHSRRVEAREACVRSVIGAQRAWSGP
jgi:hypothetical protein